MASGTPAGQDGPDSAKEKNMAVDSFHAKDTLEVGGEYQWRRDGRCGRGRTVWTASLRPHPGGLRPQGCPPSVHRVERVPRRARTCTDTASAVPRPQCPQPR